MRVVTRRTGLSPELLRVWERRYRVVTPARTHTGRRLYSDAEIERLHLLYKATLGGRSIGQIAALNTSALTELVRQDAEAERARSAPVNDPHPHGDQAARFVEDCLAAIEQLDATLFTTIVRRASIALPSAVFLERVISRILEIAGSRWRDGTLRPVHGHVAALGVRRVLEELIVPAPAGSPAILFATLGADAHELGALIAATAAAAEGWSVTWLGTGLPAEDIALAATALRVRVVGVSLVHPTGVIVVSQELRRLRAALPRATKLLVGGGAASGYADVLGEIDAAPLENLGELVQQLRQLETTAPSRRSPAKRRT